MKYFKKFIFTVGFVIILTQQWVAAQTSVRSLIPETSDVEEIKLTGRANNILSNNKNVAIINCPEAGSNVAEVQLLRTDGREIWKKKVLLK